MVNFTPTIDTRIIEKYLPHNFLAEKTILSSLLLDMETINFVSNNIKIDTFYFKNHQEIYKAIIILNEKKIPVDILTLTTFLQDNGLLEQVGGLKLLTELVNQVSNLGNLEEHIRLVQDKFFRRCLIQLGYKIINSGYITNISLENILNNLETEILSLTKTTESENFLTTTELLSNVILELKQRSFEPSLPGLASGFFDLDSITQGFQKSDLIIVAGRPSMGKTAFCLKIAINIIKNYQLPVLFFSLEMSKEQLIYRLLASETKINSLRLKSGSLYKYDWAVLNETIQILSGLPFFIDDTPDLTIQDIRIKVKNLIFEQTKIGIIIIDYLQLMQNSKIEQENRVQELSLITRGLKTIAREFNVPIITLSQLSRNVETRLNKRPILSDLRESGSIEQDADLVLMLYRNNYYSTNNDNSKEAEVIISKHRNGPIGQINLKFDAEYATFSNY